MRRITSSQVPFSEGLCSRLLRDCIASSSLLHVCRAIENTKTAHKELDNKAEIADAALANSQADIEKLQVEFNDAAGLVQQKEKELREAREAAEQKAKQLDVARSAP